jgi:hypothetical protein
MSWAQLVVAAAGLASMKAAIERGDIDEASRQGLIAGPAVVERALVSTDRALRLAGIASAPTVTGRLSLLEALATAAGGPDRRTAIPAAHAARSIARELACAAGRACAGAHPTEDLAMPDDVAPDDIGRWRAAFVELAPRPDRWIEVRVLALDTASALDPDTGELVALITRGLADPDPAFRRAAIAIVPMPVPVSLHAALSKAIAHDRDPGVALAAAAVMCGDLISDAPRPILDAIGSAGLARAQTLAGEPTASRVAAKDVGRCLAAAVKGKK